MKTRRRFILFLLAVFFMLTLYSWRMKACFNPDELFYYKSSQTLSDFRNLYAPKYFQQHRFQKPPLFYSAVFLSFKFFGINWFSARIVTVFSSILVLIMTYLLGIKMLDREKAFFGAGILATSVLFFRFGRIVLPEMALIFFMTGALYFAYTAFLENKRKFFYLAFIFMGVGTLIKGPIAFLFPGMIIIIFYAVSRKKFSLGPVPWIKGILIVLALYMLWIIPALLIYGKDFLDHVITIEVVNRITEKVQFGSFWQYARHHFQKFFFYVPVLFAQYLPWSVLVPAFLFAARGKLEKKDYAMQRRFLLIWVLTGFLFFSVVPTKMAHYVLSFFPALSLYLVSFFDFERSYIKKMFRTFLSISMAGYFLAVVVIFPHIFSDGVDRLAVKLAVALEKRDAPVAVSWRLDPQEVELYIDRPVQVIWESDFADSSEGSALIKIKKLITGAEEKTLLFYLVLAEKEYDRYIDEFITDVKKVAVKPVSYSKMYEDWYWRKTIKFRYLFYRTAKDPGSVMQYFKEAFQEKVLLLSVQKE